MKIKLRFFNFNICQLVSKHKLKLKYRDTMIEENIKFCTEKVKVKQDKRRGK